MTDAWQDLPDYRGNEEFYRSLNRQRFQQQADQVGRERLRKTINTLRQPTAPVPTTPKPNVLNQKLPGPLGNISSPNVPKIIKTLKETASSSNVKEVAKDLGQKFSQGLGTLKNNLNTPVGELGKAFSNSSLPSTKQVSKPVGTLVQQIRPPGTAGNLGGFRPPPGGLTAGAGFSSAFNPIAVATAAILDLANDLIFPRPTADDTDVALRLQEQYERQQMFSPNNWADRMLDYLEPPSDSRVVQPESYQFTGGQCSVHYRVNGYRKKVTVAPSPLGHTATYIWTNALLAGGFGPVAGPFTYYTSKIGETTGGNTSNTVFFGKSPSGGTNATNTSTSGPVNSFGNWVWTEERFTLTRDDGQPDNCGNPAPITQVVNAPIGTPQLPDYVLEADFGDNFTPLFNPAQNPVQKATEPAVTPPSRPIPPKIASSQTPDEELVSIPTIVPIPTFTPFNHPDKATPPAPAEETTPIETPTKPLTPKRSPIGSSTGTGLDTKIGSSTGYGLDPDRPVHNSPFAPLPEQGNHPGPFQYKGPLPIPLIPAKLPTGKTIQDGSKKGTEALPKPTPTPVTQTPQDNCRGGCTGKVLDGIDSNRKAIENNNVLINNLPQQPVDLSLLNVINTKLGDQVPGGIGGFITKAFRATRLDKVINALTLLTALHNAAMLSRSLLDTLSSAIDNALVAFNLKDENESPLDIGNAIGDTVENYLKNLLGNDVYNNLSENWKKANRIYQSAANIMSISQGLFWSMKEVMEETGERVGKIGNALRRSGVVMEDSYNWMSEKLNISTGRIGALQKVVDGVNSAENVVSDIDNITSELREVGELSTELQTQSQEFKNLVETGDPEANRENAPIKTDEDEKQEQSQGSNIAIPDLIKPES